MGKVLIDLSMSLDGFITGADPTEAQALGGGDGNRLHEWYFNGNSPSPYNDVFMPGKGSEVVVEEMFTTTGAIVVGRKWYDVVNGWEGNHPIKGATIVVLTHDVPDDVPQGDSPIQFVTEGIERAVAQAKEAAGDKDVGVGGANIAQQALNKGLVDEIHIHLVPVLLGDGVRLFDALQDGIRLEQGEVTQAEGVTHLRYRVVK
jgi:dihydrofolate reductase